MHILVLGRALPTEKSGSLGLFEFEQAIELSKHVTVGFIFIETSSILSNRQIKIENNFKDKMPIIGCYFPVKGLPNILYQKIRFKLFEKIFNLYISKYGIPDIIHIHYPLITINKDILNFLKTKNIGIVVTEHWSRIQQRMLSRHQIQLLSEVLIESNRFISVSDVLKDSIINIIKQNNPQVIDKNLDKLVVIPNMISDIFFHQYISTRQNKEFVFTYIGSLSKNKRVDLLISAFQNSFSQNEDVILNIIGEGREKNKLKKMVKMPNKPQVIFWGNLSKEKIAGILLETSIYVSASNIETFGAPFIEAMAMGIPVIATKCGGPESFVNETNGLLIEKNNQKSLENAMSFMYANIVNYDKKEIIRNIYKNYSGNSIAKSLINIYKNILKNN